MLCLYIHIFTQMVLFFVSWTESSSWGVQWRSGLPPSVSPLFFFPLFSLAWPIYIYALSLYSSPFTCVGIVICLVLCDVSWALFSAFSFPVLRTLYTYSWKTQGPLQKKTTIVFNFFFVFEFLSLLLLFSFLFSHYGAHVRHSFSFIIHTAFADVPVRVFVSHLFMCAYSLVNFIEKQSCFLFFFVLVVPVWCTLFCFSFFFVYLYVVLRGWRALKLFRVSSTCSISSFFLFMLIYKASRHTFGDVTPFFFVSACFSIFFPTPILTLPFSPVHFCLL